MQQEGHIVGNHTYTHPDMSKISTKEAFEKELGELSTLYQKTTGEEMTKFYRPPQGKYSEANLQMAKEMGYHTFFWSLAYVDWYQNQQPTREEAFEKLLGRIHPWCDRPPPQYFQHKCLYLRRTAHKMGRDGIYFRLSKRPDPDNIVSFTLKSPHLNLPTVFL